MDAITSQKPWLAQKYGGTSLGKLLDTICNRIIPTYLEGYRLVVVCSALSGTTKSSGTTSRLLECIAQVEEGYTAQKRLNASVDAIRESHLAVLDRYLVHSNGTRGRIHEAAEAEVKDECETLRRFLLAAQIVGELSPRAQDRVIALGEKLACRIMTAFLNSNGIPAETIILDDIVESVFGPSVLEQGHALDALSTKFYEHLATEIRRRVDGCGDKIPIVTGFFGIMPHSLLKTVGRGYSDLCASMCAVATGAVELQIWKEVDGIFTADPRKVPSARLLSTVTPEEATELTYYGSEVIHPLTMDQIRFANIPLRLKNVFNPSGSGTIIYRIKSPSPPPTPPSPALGEEAAKIRLPGSSFMLAHGYHGQQQERRRPTAVTVKDSITLVNVACNRNTKSQGFLAGVFNRLEENRIAVDLVTTSEGNISLAVQEAEGGMLQQVRLKGELEKFGKAVITENMSIVTVVGHKMRNMVGTSNEILSALASARINIYMVSQGASEINISLVVRAEDATLAMNMIHGKVLQIPTHWEQENDFIKGPWLY